MVADRADGSKGGMLVLTVRCAGQGWERTSLSLVRQVADMSRGLEEGEQRLNPKSDSVQGLSLAVSSEQLSK